MAGEIDRAADPQPETPGPVPRRAGPTDFANDAVKDEVRRAAVWIGMATLVVGAVFMAQPLLVIFGGLVFAAMIDGGARLLGREAAPPELLHDEPSARQVDGPPGDHPAGA